jgi:ApbE superfamily uncharacterized protein (UPF0280 family)
MNGPLRARFADGRWHFQHGPIDLVIGASGAPGAVAAALEDCWVAFGEVLPALVAELPQLRSPCTPTLQLRGPVARRMLRACRPFADGFGLFVTPMAAVAGAVADHLIGWLRRPGVARAYINNGGDIALHLTDGESFDIGLIADIDAPRLDGSLRIDSGDPVRGVATSGWRGRSFSFGIADRVTVLAADAAAADAAATMIANHVDVAAPGIERAPADSLRDDTDLGSRLVTVRVPPLPAACIDAALERGAAFARQCLARGLIQAALLTVQGRSRMLAAQPTTALA